MITIEDLKKYAEKLEFTMTESEFITLQKEFNLLLEEVDKLNNIENLSNYEPLSFPYKLSSSYLREDKVDNSLSKEEAFKNSLNKIEEGIYVPKVVE